MPIVPAADRAHRGNPAAGGAPVHSHGGGVAGARQADRHEVGGLVGSKGQDLGRNNESRERTCWVGEAGRLLARGERRGREEQGGASHPRQALGQLERERHSSLSPARCLSTKRPPASTVGRFAGGPAGMAVTPKPRSSASPSLDGFALSSVQTGCASGGPSPAPASRELCHNNTLGWHRRCISSEDATVTIVKLVWRLRKFGVISVLRVCAGQVET